MNRYPSVEVLEFHDRKRQTHTVETAKFAEIGEFEFYLDDFKGQDCDYLVSVISCEDPTHGVDPLITVSNRIPEALWPYFALHEYIEFHTARRQPEDGHQSIPNTCWEIEKYVLSQFNDLRLAREYASCRIEMFDYIGSNLGGLTDDMEATARYLVAYKDAFIEVDALRAQSREAYKTSQHLVGLAMDAEAVLRSGGIAFL